MLYVSSANENQVLVSSPFNNFHLHRCLATTDNETRCLMSSKPRQEHWGFGFSVNRAINIDKLAFKDCKFLKQFPSDKT